MTSSSGYLFGAPCTVGMKVVVMQSVAGDTTVSSVYAQDREMAIYLLRGAVSASAVPGGRQAGHQGRRGAGVHLWVHPVGVPAHGVSGLVPLLGLRWLVCAVTTLVTMYLIGGPTRKTAVATAGTVAGVVIAGLAATALQRRHRRHRLERQRH